MTQQNKNKLDSAHKSHPRSFLESKYVYPVLSRRSGGISIGINLSPERVCNFNCVYCQVKNEPIVAEVEKLTESEMLDQIERELIDLTQKVYNGELFEFEPFCNIDEKYRKLCDYSFSGDGEPTSFPGFDQVCAKIADIKKQYAKDDVKIVLITNSTLLHKPKVQEGLAVLDLNNGEIWAKLDAGTEEYYQIVNRSAVSFQKIIDNILRTAQKRPIKIQTLFMEILGKGPDEKEIDAYVEKLNYLTGNGAVIISVQIHTIARQPAESYASSLADDEIDRIASYVHEKTELKVESYYGSKF